MFTVEITIHNVFSTDFHGKIIIILISINAPANDSLLKN